MTGFTDEGENDFTDPNYPALIDPVTCSSDRPDGLRKNPGRNQPTVPRQIATGTAIPSTVSDGFSLEHEERVMSDRQPGVDGRELDRGTTPTAVGIEIERAAGRVVEDPVVGIERGGAG